MGNHENRKYDELSGENSASDRDDAHSHKSYKSHKDQNLKELKEIVKCSIATANFQEDVENEVNPLFAI